MTLGEKLQKLRKARSLTQEELAAKVGVSRQSLSKWESDGALPDTANIILLADLFGVTTDYLLREAAPCETAPAEQPSATSVPQPQEKVPPIVQVISWTLIVLGALVLIGILIAASGNPHTVIIGSREFRGLIGYIKAHKIEWLYYGSLGCMAVGTVVNLVYAVLRRRVNRSKSTSSTTP